MRNWKVVLGDYSQIERLVAYAHLGTPNTRTSTFAAARNDTKRGRPTINNADDKGRQLAPFFDFASKEYFEMILLAQNTMFACPYLASTCRGHRV